ncbi:MAG: hypothetical protein AMQ22_00214 [Candidatus Methanofastidiosum methylothiophilum]|uniref:Uncharacterized protein n=1 Tax=Candidatus Methanofastidiosum methylothiophilum TaxID=1705564 RepID=A0A150J8G0_9EURY|nr:MAG: hypothetical protein AMQ22_00214 [Candidatus Methanofastidiosum methylthiophilus]
MLATKRVIKLKPSKGWQPKTESFYGPSGARQRVTLELLGRCNLGCIQSAFITLLDVPELVANMSPKQLRNYKRNLFRNKGGLEF